MIAIDTENIKEIDNISNFNKIANIYEKVRPLEPLVLDKLALILNMQKNQFILDIGCGTGIDLKYLQEKYKIKPFGIDKSCKMVNNALLNIGKNVTCIDAIEYIKDNKKKFHSIYFKLSLHHFVNQQQILIDTFNMTSKIAIVSIHPSQVNKWILTKYFPTLKDKIFDFSIKQLDVIESFPNHLNIKWQKVDCILQEEFYTLTLINSIKQNYVSFFKYVPLSELTHGLLKLKKDIINEVLPTKKMIWGTIYYGKRKNS